jgi:hypothetical protein
MLIYRSNEHRDRVKAHEEAVHYYKMVVGEAGWSWSTFAAGFVRALLYMFTHTKCPLNKSKYSCLMSKVKEYRSLDRIILGVPLQFSVNQHCFVVIPESIEGQEQFIKLTVLDSAGMKDVYDVVNATVVTAFSRKVAQKEICELLKRVNSFRCYYESLQLLEESGDVIGVDMKQRKQRIATCGMDVYFSMAKRYMSAQEYLSFRTHIFSRAADFFNAEGDERLCGIASRKTLSRELKAKLFEIESSGDRLKSADSNTGCILNRFSSEVLSRQKINCLAESQVIRPIKTLTWVGGQNSKGLPESDGVLYVSEVCFCRGRMQDGSFVGDVSISYMGEEIEAQVIDGVLFCKGEEKYYKLRQMQKQIKALRVKYEGLDPSDLDRESYRSLQAIAPTRNGRIEGLGVSQYYYKDKLVCTKYGDDYHYPDGAIWKGSVGETGLREGRGVLIVPGVGVYNGMMIKGQKNDSDAEYIIKGFGTYTGGFRDGVMHGEASISMNIKGSDTVKTLELEFDKGEPKCTDELKDHIYMSLLNVGYGAWIHASNQFIQAELEEFSALSAESPEIDSARELCQTLCRPEDYAQARLAEPKALIDLSTKRHALILSIDSLQTEEDRKKWVYLTLYDSSGFWSGSSGKKAITAHKGRIRQAQLKSMVKTLGAMSSKVDLARGISEEVNSVIDGFLQRVQALETKELQRVQKGNFCGLDVWQSVLHDKLGPRLFLEFKTFLMERSWEHFSGRKGYEMLVEKAARRIEARQMKYHFRYGGAVVFESEEFSGYIERLNNMLETQIRLQETRSGTQVIGLLKLMLLNTMFDKPDGEHEVSFALSVLKKEVRVKLEISQGRVAKITRFQSLDCK